ncbi:MAG: ABC transporter permease [Planctomycetes bacterium]|nr:ABC transporter permease [Planctomycetota bacterium]MCB9905577.1 ABC transporter permease [Planctomycetota bacterium]
MLNYILRRVLWAIPTLLGILFMILVCMHAAPGDPAAMALGLGAGGGGEVSEKGANIEAKIEEFRKEHALDRSFVVQYLGYLGPFNVRPDGHEWFGGTGKEPWGGLLALDFGKELINKNKSVGDELKRRLMQVTIPLALISTFLTYLLAIPIGIYSANRRGTRIDKVMTLGLFVLYSIPVFWAGLMLQLIFGAEGLNLLPVMGMHGPDADQMNLLEWLWDSAKHMVLPVTVSTYGGLAYISRQMRTGMIEVIHQDYIRTARAKGLSERTVVLKHALRNSLIPVITLFASILPILIGGSIVIEYVFDLPGMGEYMYKGLLSRDYNIIMSVMALTSVMTLAGILLSDIAYALVDPRISYS